MPTSLASIEDRFALIDVLSNYATGLDARDWVLWRSVFLDEVVFDLSSWSGQPARALDSTRVVASQARMFAELTVTQHFITNHRVFIDGDRARVLAHMRAEHWIDTPAPASGTDRYTMFGYYDDKLVRTTDGWKIAEMQLNVTRTEGDRWVMSEASRRASAKRGSKQA
ncbi:MAG: nuclear transport factor 2 family protein [Gammaproteobacteria bacterium]|nr:nuclear transport factor 2 family protein [Gammaproteobacteria bacterium]